MGKEEIEAAFPELLRSGGYSITSPATPEYNCIAWAAGDTERFWWPDQLFLGYWPSEAPRTETREAFVRAYEIIGYALCRTGDDEQGYEKVAIYVGSDGKPTHAARQLESGRWTSKLGQIEDIEHATLNGVEGETYGSATIFMKRPLKQY